MKLDVREFVSSIKMLNNTGIKTQIWLTELHRDILNTYKYQSFLKSQK